MPGNKMSDLRDHLFKTLEGLRDKSMDVDRAEAVASVASVVIESAKTELKFMELAGRDVNSDFFPPQKVPQLASGNGNHAAQITDKTGVATVRRAAPEPS